MAKVTDDIWRLRARGDVLRAIADGLRDDEARTSLLRLAEGYDQLANHMAEFASALPGFELAVDSAAR